MCIWQNLFIASSVGSELKSPIRENDHTLMNMNQSLYWYVLNISWSSFYGDYSYKLLAIFCFLRFYSIKKYSLSCSIHQEFINLKRISSLKYRIYLLLCYSCQVCMVLSKISCTIECLKMKNRALFRKSFVSRLYLKPFHWETQTFFQNHNFTQVFKS